MSISRNQMGGIERRAFMRNVCATFGSAAALGSAVPILAADAPTPAANAPHSGQESNTLLVLQLKFAEPVDPTGARTGHDPKEILGREEKPFAPAQIFMQTTDADGFVFGYARAHWTSETTCDLVVLEITPMGLEATCRVQGFGQVICRADNRGQLYSPESWKNGMTFLFDVEAADSEIANAAQRLQRYQDAGLRFDAGVTKELDRAEQMLKAARGKTGDDEKLRGANQALGIALQVSEKLEVSRAQQRLAALGRKRPFSFGAFLYGDLTEWKGNAQFADLYRGIFNSAAVSFMWQQIQPKDGGPLDWSFFDVRTQFVRDTQVQGISHCVGWPQALPEWLIKQPLRLHDELMSFLDATIDRYGDAYPVWSLMNESQDWYGMFTSLPMPLRERALLFKDLRARVLERLPGTPIEADTCVTNASWRMIKPEWPIGPMEYYKGLHEVGLRDFTIGLQMYHGGGEYATFDMGRWAQRLETYCRLGQPIHVYADTPSELNPDARLKVHGAWHGEWSEARQADWWEQFMTIVLSFPEVRGITIVCLTDKNMLWMPGGAFCRGDLSKRPVYDRLRGVLDQYVDRNAKPDWSMLGRV